MDASGDNEAVAERIGFVDPDLAETGRDGGAFDRLHDSGAFAQGGRGFDPANEAAADITFMDETVAHLQSALRNQMRHAGRGAGAAGAAIDGAFAVENGIAAIGAVA